MSNTGTQSAMTTTHSWLSYNQDERARLQNIPWRKYCAILVRCQFLSHETAGTARHSPDEPFQFPFPMGWESDIHAEFDNKAFLNRELCH